jgi:hypothetical protein
MFPATPTSSALSIACATTANPSEYCCNSGGGGGGGGGGGVVAQEPPPPPPVMAQLQCPGYQYYCESFGLNTMMCSTEEAIPGFAVPSINTIDQNARCTGLGADPCEEISVVPGINGADMLSCQNKQGLYCCMDFGVAFNPSPPPPSPLPPPRPSQPPMVPYVSLSPMPPSGGGGGGGGMPPAFPTPPTQANGCLLDEYSCDRNSTSRDTTLPYSLKCVDAAGASVDETDCDADIYAPDPCMSITWSAASTHNPGGRANCYFAAPGGTVDLAKM